ncbi:MAG: hypothetical protein AAGA18_00965 [Verrucomicrobiota bacterium]
MGRRANSKPTYLWILPVAILIIAALAGGFFVFQKSDDPYRTIPALDVQAYLDNANSLRGNVYKIEGSIQESLRWTASNGRIFSVEVGEPGGAKPLAIVVPPKFNDINIQKGQKFSIKIQIVKDGVIEVIDLSKS